MKIKKILAVMLCMVLVFSLAACSSGGEQKPAEEQKAAGEQKPAEEKKPKIVSVGTAGMGGTYYPVGVGLGKIIESYVEGTKVSVELTGGTMENPVLIAQDKMEFAIANEHLAEFARTGKAPFDTLKEHNVMALASGLNKGYTQYVVSANSKIQSPKDLKGKKIAVGPQGNGSIPVLQHVLEFYGIKWDEIQASYINYSEGMQALADGRVDMALSQAGLPTPAVVELAAGKHKFRILSLPNRDELLKRYPYVKADIPANTYDGQTEMVETIATQNMLIVNSNVDEEFVYEVTKALFENVDEFRAAHGSISSFNIDDAVKTVVPIHPGALKYYKEKGVVK